MQCFMTGSAHAIWRTHASGAVDCLCRFTYGLVSPIQTGIPGATRLIAAYAAWYSSR